MYIDFKYNNGKCTIDTDDKEVRNALESYIKFLGGKTTTVEAKKNCFTAKEKAELDAISNRMIEYASILGNNLDREETDEINDGMLECFLEIGRIVGELDFSGCDADYNYNWLDKDWHEIIEEFCENVRYISEYGYGEEEIEYVNNIYDDWCAMTDRVYSAIEENNCCCCEDCEFRKLAYKIVELVTDNI